MVVAEKIQQYVQKLPAPFQSEVLDFVQYLLAKVEQETGNREEKAWSALSLAYAMRNMEEENHPIYTLSDLKVTFS
jgi:hypothetical protein